MSTSDMNSTKSTAIEEVDLETKGESILDENVTEDCPVILETAPFPTLGTVQEISKTISRVRSNHSHKSEHHLSSKEEAQYDESPPVVFKQEPYPTEGIRNPGWLAVISNFLANFFVFGTTFSWGNYQSLYLNEIYAGQTTLLEISFAGTAANALLLAAGLFITPVVQKLGFRITMLIGTIICPLSLILASFATQLWHIYLSQGVLFGIFAAFVFSTSVTLPSQWFTRRRALATGIAVSGTGIGGVCISPMVVRLISTVGYRNALRVQGCFGFGVLGIATALAVSRYRPPPMSGSDKWYNLFDRKLLTVRYMLLLTFCFFVSFGYIAPFFLAPEFVLSIGLDASVGATSISILSASNAVCRICLGYLADKFGKFNIMFVCTFLAGAFTMVIWQLAHNYATFAVYCVLYGLSAGGFVSLLPVTTAEIVGVENIQRGLGLAYFSTIFGSLLGSPLIGLLYSSRGWTSSIQFAGSLTIGASVFLLILRIIMSKKVFAKI